MQEEGLAATLKALASAARQKRTALFWSLDFGESGFTEKRKIRLRFFTWQKRGRNLVRDVQEVLGDVKREGIATDDLGQLVSNLLLQLALLTFSIHMEVRPLLERHKSRYIRKTLERHKSPSIPGTYD